MSLAGEEGNLATAAAFPRAPARWHAGEALGRRGKLKGCQQQSVWVAAALYVRRVEAVEGQQGQGVASRGGALAGKAEQKQRSGGAAWRGEDAPVEEGSGAREGREG